MRVKIGTSLNVKLRGVSEDSIPSLMCEHKADGDLPTSRREAQDRQR